MQAEKSVICFQSVLNANGLLCKGAIKCQKTLGPWKMYPVQTLAFNLGVYILLLPCEREIGLSNFFWKQPCYTNGAQKLCSSTGHRLYYQDFTCVSLKSLTPTQYTIAPRDLAFSACRNSGEVTFWNAFKCFFFPFTSFPCRNSMWLQPMVHLLLCSDELVFLQLPVCECNDHAGRAWKGH